MAFPFLLLAGALLGKKKQEQEQAEFNRQREIQAETTRMSPWTGMQAAAPVAPKGKLANMASGALSGWAMQQSLGGAVNPSSAAPATNASSWQNMSMGNDGMNKFGLNYASNPTEELLKNRQMYMGYGQQPSFGSPWNF